MFEMIGIIVVCIIGLIISWYCIKASYFACGSTIVAFLDWFDMIRQYGYYQDKKPHAIVYLALASTPLVWICSFYEYVSQVGSDLKTSSISYGRWSFNRVKVTSQTDEDIQYNLGIKQAR